ncbi:hypothetical protein [Prosthecobacter sp.]|uniref:hypothetical protein n=1 Tax=Prosthecobacter sp. TaxID=1965333 RepID=UPI003784973F
MARYAPWWCLPLGHLAVAMILNEVHGLWIDQEMRRPGWDGLPDLDIVFAIGVMTEIGFVSGILLPVTALGLYLKWREVRRARQGVHHGALGVSFL